MKIVIQAMEARKDSVDEILAHLPESATVVWDEKGLAMHTFLRAMREAGDGPSLHLEDDIVLTSNFQSKLADGLARARAAGAAKGIADPLVQFFSMRGDDLTIGSRWDRNFMMNQCWYAPAGFAREILSYFPVWNPQNPGDPHGYDLMMNHLLKRKKTPYWIHCPSLVQHREGKSLIGPRSSRRQSKTFEA